MKFKSVIGVLSIPALLWFFQPIIFSEYDRLELTLPADIGSFDPKDMNDIGDVIGNFQKKPTDQGYVSGGFVYRSGSFEEVIIKKQLAEKDSWAELAAINNLGQIVGTWYADRANRSSGTEVFSYSKNASIKFYSWSTNHFAIDINDLGHVLAWGTGKRVCSKKYDLNSTAPGPIPRIDDFCDRPSMIVDRSGQIDSGNDDDFSRPNAINNSGQISFSKDGAFYSEHAINNLGVVAGQWSSQGRFVAFANKQDAAMFSLPTDTHESSAHSINDEGVVIGKRHDPITVPFLPVPIFWGDYFIYKNGTMQNLRIVSGLPRFKYDSIDFLKVNNMGQILVQVRNGKAFNALVLTPKR